MPRLVRAPIGGSMDLAWIEVAELVLLDLQGLVVSLSSAGFEAPIVGFELLDDKGRVVSEAELAWQEHRIAVFLADSATNLTKEFSDRAWCCFVVGYAGELEAKLIAALEGKREESMGTRHPRLHCRMIS